MSEKHELFMEMNSHLLEDEVPSLYFCRKFQPSAFASEYPFAMLSRLEGTCQSPLHHPEGSVWNHTMLVVDQAAKRRHQSADAQVLMWAALLHDVGKAKTTRLKKGKITSYDHEKIGAPMAADFLEALSAPPDFSGKVSHMVRWHMQLLYVTKNMPFADACCMMENVDIKEIALLGLCDRLGRGGKTDEKAELDNLRIFMQIVQKL